MIIGLRRFVRYYEFLLQASSFEDVELHKKYNFISYLLSYLNISHSGSGFDITGKIKASDELKAKACSNTAKNFELAYFDSIDDALLEGWSQNQDFFSLLLNNKDIKQQLMGIFAGEIYNSLRHSV